MESYGFQASTNDRKEACETTCGVMSRRATGRFDAMDDVKARQQRFGRNVGDSRRAARLSQRALALMIGTTQSYVWRLESGRINPTLDMQCRIADALGVAVRDLIDF